MFGKMLSSLLLCFSLGAWADAVSTDTLFSDSYEGYLYRDTDPYWYEDSSRKVFSYSQPKLTAETSELELDPICIEGGGGDCTMGVLYKSRVVDGLGNPFYLVKDAQAREGWVNSNVWIDRNFDERFLDMNGAELTIAENFVDTDSSDEDDVPDLELERKKQLKKILRHVSPMVGRVSLEIPGDKISLKVRDSNLPTEGEFIDYPLSINPYFFVKKDKVVEVETAFYRQQDNFLAVVLPAMKGLNVTENECDGYSLNYVWLDTQGIKVTLNIKETESPIKYLVGEFERGFSVEQIKVFNGKRYALVMEYLSVKNPFALPEDDSIKRDNYTIPYKWIKIRDQNQRLRFWMSSFSC
jgi:hypothetical protein